MVYFEKSLQVHPKLEMMDNNSCTDVANKDSRLQYNVM